MDLRRLRAGDWIAALSGAVLLGSLLLPWYERGPIACIAVVGVNCPEPRSFSGFEALTVIDWVLVAVALFALALWVVTVTQGTAAVPVATGALLVLLAVVALVFVGVRLVDVPELGRNVERAAGVYLAFAATLGVVVGAAVAIRDERQPAMHAREVEAMRPPSPAEPTR
jgi:NO-binding membrane sensor protein with MHYT domain